MRASAPLVSVIIDNYNYAQFLGPAIASALAQTYPHVEVVVVDDGSTDTSREVISSYHGLIRPVLKANGGQASAMNAGCDASRGAIVMFLDSDDLLHPDAVDRVVGRLMPGDSKAHFRLQVIDDDGCSGSGTVPARKFPLGSGDVVAEVLRRGRYVSSPNSGNAFPRWVIEQMGPVPGDLRAADTFYG
jgi:glycosyltransferase involved in cell wall biosynthesis